MLSLGLSLCRPGRASAWSPAAIPDLAARWIADDLRGVVADAAKVASWAPAAGDTTLAHGTDGNRPVFDEVNPQFAGHASVNFAKGSTQYLFASTGALITAMSGSDKPITVVAAVRRFTKVTAEEMLFSLGNTASGTQMYFAGGWVFANSNSQRLRFRIRDDAGTAEFGPANGLNEITDLAPQVLCFAASGAAANHYVVGATQNPYYDATVSSAASTDYSAQGEITFNRFALGAFLRSTATLPADMEVAEVCVYTRELTAAERQRVCDYLWDRYCRNPTPAAIPPRLQAGLVHDWDAAAVLNDVGTGCSSLPDQVSAKHATQGTSANRPTVIQTETGLKALRFDGSNDFLTAGVAADFANLHNNADLSVFVVYRPLVGHEALAPILDTLDNDPTNRNGLGIYHDGASAAHRLQIRVGATNATPVLAHDSQNFGSRPGAWHIAHFTFEASVPSSEENFQIWIDNENYAAVDPGVTPAAGDPSFALHFGKLANTATFGAFDLAEVVVYDRKLGRPGDSQIVHEFLAKRWGTSHVALAGGNGLANLLNDARTHRGFPALCQDATGTWHCIYRSATTHGSSRGVGVQVTSVDGIHWSKERIIYDIDDADGRDWRGGASLICLKYGPHAGRLLCLTNWATDTSGLEVAGFASTNLLGISDDNGGSWTWINPQENDPKNVYESPWDYTVANAACLIELSNGRILMTFTSKDAAFGTSDQDLNLAYSDDGGETWSDSVIIGLHDVCFNNQANKRVTESWIIEWDDGALTMFIRNDTDLEIWRATATIADVEDWTFDAAKLFDGWGRPMAIRDPNDPDACYMVHRADPGDLTVWRHSWDRGVTWTEARAFSNLHQNTPFDPYLTMSYVYAANDGDGNLWLAFGLERNVDSDVFVRRWAWNDGHEFPEWAAAENIGNRPTTANWQENSGVTPGVSSAFVADGRNNRDHVWHISDGSLELLLAQNVVDGSDAGTFTIAGFTAVDVEDVASCVTAQGPRVYLADIGDNSSARSTIQICRVVEPTIWTEIPSVEYPLGTELVLYRFDAAGATVVNSGTGGATYDSTYSGNAARSTTAVAKLGTHSLTGDGTGDGVDSLFGSGRNPSTDSFTITGWFRWSGAASGTTQHIFGVSSTADNRRWYARYRHTTGTWGYRVQGAAEVTTDVTVVSGRWYHIAMVADAAADEVRFYVDGVLKGTTSYTSFTLSASIFVGTNRENGSIAHGEGFQGFCDDFGIHESALSVEQITQLFHAGAESGAYGGTISGGNVEVITCEYPGAAVPSHKDAETLLVDSNGDMYVITKRITPAQIYKLPHAASYSGTQTLQYLGTIWTPPETVGMDETNAGYYVGGSISPDGSLIVLRGYENVYWFRRRPFQLIREALMTPGVAVPTYVGKGNHPAQEPKGEGACLMHDGSLITTSEYLGGFGSGSGYPTFRYPRSV